MTVAAPLAVTMGDPAGIGLDITLLAWTMRAERAPPPFVLFADPDAVAARAKALGIEAPVALIGARVGVVSDPPGLTPEAMPEHGVKPEGSDTGAQAPNPAEKLLDGDALQDATAIFAHVLPIAPIPLAVPPRPGQPDLVNAPAIIASIEAAIAAVMRGEARALVTNPIAKSVLYDAGFSYPGHTEFLAHVAGRETGRATTPVMMLASGELKVVPLTIHIPLADAPKAITRELIVQTVRILDAALRRDFGIAEPRIAVAGLNPHAGEGGALGREELDVITPAIAALRDEGMRVTGPHSADTMFHAAARETYDAAVCMYHDQALIPIKTLAFDTGVNVTLGLPFVRTSPDHGTAFAIAGTGRASPESFIASLRMADAMARRRSQADARRTLG